MTITDCRYDYYQVALEVKLSEEDSCLFSRYGHTVFSIKKTGSAKKDCNTCSTGTDVDEKTNTRVKVEATVPDAAILSISVDRCDCTKAIFNLMVRLPCVRVCSLSNCEKTTIRDLVDGIKQYLSGVLNCKTFLQNESDAFNLASDTLLPCGSSTTSCDVFLTNVETMISATKALRSELLGDGGLTTTDCPIPSIDSLLHILQNILDALLLNTGLNNGVFKDSKFTLASSASGCEKDILTFYVKPLDANVVSTGVFGKCYSYEITRVPGRAFNTESITIDNETCEYARCADGRIVHVATECETPCASVPVALVPNVLHVTLPLTKELKCLMSDFGFPDTLTNAYLGKTTTIVKIMSKCPQKYSFPAKMSFDKTNCTVCLEISASAVSEYLDHSNPHLYNSQFGRFGCASLCKDTRCSDEVDLACLIKDNQFGTYGYNCFFSFLAMSRGFDVVGVHKCTEKSFFSFQVCTVPYKPLCVDVCGCKLQTVPDLYTLDQCELRKRYDTSAIYSDSTLPANSFKVHSDCEYTYEFTLKRAC